MHIIRKSETISIKIYSIVSKVHVTIIIYLLDLFTHIRHSRYSPRKPNAYASIITHTCLRVTHISLSPHLSISPSLSNKNVRN